MSYEEDNSYKPSSIREIVAFWKYLYKRGRMTRILLYLATSLLLLLLLTYLVQDTLDNVLGQYSFPIFVFPSIVLVMFILYTPTLPRLYRVQFQGKFRHEITEEELRGLLMELAGKSLELISIIFGAISVTCIAVYEAAKLILLPDSTTIVLLAATALDIILISLLVSTLGRYNLNFLRRTFSEDEYRRYSSLSNYKNIFLALIAINALAVVFLIYGLLSPLL